MISFYSCDSNWYNKILFWFAVRVFIEFDVCYVTSYVSFGAGVYNLECPKGGVKAIKVVEKRPT